jgi:SAM-dependent methyltransferase
MNRITTEEPNVHWEFLDIKGKRVLDLGCGKFWSSISTAEWMINCGARIVIGIDLSDIGLNSNKFTMIVEQIRSKEQLENLFVTYLPEVIKCDIEGAEIYLDGIALPNETKQFAVEYHDATTKAVCEKMIKEWGFKNVTYYQLFTEDINRIGVINAVR